MKLFANTRNIALVVVLAIMTVALLSLQAPTPPTPLPVSKPSPETLLKHPIYSTYDLTQSDSVIHFGVQPQWVFKGNIAEAMRRDPILNEALAKLGMTIRFHAFLTGKELGYFASEGYLQGGIAGDMPTLQIADKSEVVIPALSDQGFGYIIGRNIHLVEELRGKRIAFPFGSYAHHLLLEALAAEQIPVDEVELLPMKPSKMPKALRDKKIDAFSVWEPYASMALNEVSEATMVQRSRYIAFVHFTREFFQKHPEAARQILAAETRAVRWMLKERGNLLRTSQWAVARGKEIFGDLYDVSPEAFSEVISKVAGMNLSPAIPKTDLEAQGYIQREFEFLQALGRISSDRSWSAFSQAFDQATMLDIIAKPDEYRLNDFRYPADRGK